MTYPGDAFGSPADAPSRQVPRASTRHHKQRGRHAIDISARSRDVSHARLRRRRTMGLSWQQGPLAPGAVGKILTPEPLPERLLYAEPLRRRMRVRFADTWIADSEDVVLLHEPGHYPVAYFPLSDIADDALEDGQRVTSHRDFGATSWYTVRAGEQSKPRAAWQHTELP